MTHRQFRGNPLHHQISRQLGRKLSRKLSRQRPMASSRRVPDTAARARRKQPQMAGAAGAPRVRAPPRFFYFKGMACFVYDTSNGSPRRCLVFVVGCFTISRYEDTQQIYKSKFCHWYPIHSKLSTSGIAATLAYGGCDDCGPWQCWGTF